MSMLYMQFSWCFSGLDALGLVFSKVHHWSLMPSVSIDELGEPLKLVSGEKQIMPS